MCLAVGVPAHPTTRQGNGGPAGCPERNNAGCLATGVVRQVPSAGRAGAGNLGPPEAACLLGAEPPEPAAAAGRVMQQDVGGEAAR